MSVAFAYLSDADRERLRLLPFPVALPQRLPQGWTLQPPQIFEDPDDGETSLEVPFQGPESARWSVTTTDGGVGDTIAGETEHSFKVVEHELFGNILVHSFKEDDVPEVQSDWFPEDEEAEVFHSFRGAHVLEGDLALLVRSLDLLETPP